MKKHSIDGHRSHSIHREANDWARRLQSLALSLLCAVAVIATGGTASATSPRYNQVMMTGPHNTMQKFMPPGDMAGALDIRSFEIDINGYDDLPGDWRVYHVWSGTATHAYYLSDYLRLFNGYHNTNPQHEVITIWIDTRWSFGPETPGLPTAEDLDTLLLNTFGEDTVFSPRDLWDRCPNPGKVSLQHAVNPDFGPNCQWPTLEELRGKFIFVLTGYDAPTYFHTSVQLTHEFFASFEDVEEENLDQYNSVLFFNYGEVPSQSLIDAIQDEHHATVRAFGTDDETKFNLAKQRGVNTIGTDCHDDSDAGSWCHTRNSDFPFLPVPGSGAATYNIREVGKRKVSISRPSSGDTFLYYYDNTQRADIESQVNYEVWNGYYSTSFWASTGHGCVIARASASGGTFFAVCRPNGTPNGSPLSSSTMRNYVWYSGAAPVESPYPYAADYPDHRQNEHTYLKIEITPNPNGSGVMAWGYGCAGKDYDCNLIKTAVFPSTNLPYRGIHVWNAPGSGSTVKFDFTNSTVGNRRLNPSAPVEHFGTPPSTITWNAWGGLTIGASYLSASVAAGMDLYPNLDFKVPPSGMLFSDLHGSANDPDLYLKQGANPTWSSHDASSTSNYSTEWIKWVNTTGSPQTMRAGAHQWLTNANLVMQNTVQAYVIGSETLTVSGYGWSGPRYIWPRVGQNLRIATTSSADHALYVQAYYNCPTASTYYRKSDWAPQNGTDSEVVNFMVPDDQRVCVNVYNKTPGTISVSLLETGD